MIGSKKEVTQKYFLSSQDEFIHRYPVEDEHVKYEGEEIFDGTDWYEKMKKKEEKGIPAKACSKCLKTFIAY